MRLIDADALIENIKRMYCTECDSYGGVRCRACGTDDAIDMIDDAPTVDVKKKALMQAFSKFSGHSDYHGDTILCSLKCMAEGKEVSPAKPIPYRNRYQKLADELSHEDLLALRAVAYGANTNKKLVCGIFTVYNDDRSVKEQIPFSEAIETVYTLLGRIMEGNTNV